MPLSSNLVQTAGLRVHHLQQGTGDPVVLLHGFPQTSHEWRHQMGPLADAGHAVFAPDTRGFGGTDKPHVRVTRQLLARDVIDLLDALGLERVHLVGHDWGGIIAFAAAVEFPERFRTLGLVDTLTTVWVPWAVHGYWFKSPGRAEDFFARHAVEWIRSVFGGVPGSYAGPPVSPWAPPAGAARPAARVDDPSKHWDADDVERFAAAFADPDSHWHAIQYYRYALPFHRIVAGAGPDGRDAYEFLDEPAVAAMWEHPGGLGEHPLAREYLAFGPEHRDRTFPGPALYLGSPYLPARDPADPFADSFRRSLADFEFVGVDCGHFVPEERPRLTTDALLALFRRA